MFLRFVLGFIVGLVGVIGVIQTIGNDFIVAFILALAFGVLGAMTGNAT